MAEDADISGMAVIDLDEQMVRAIAGDDELRVRLGSQASAGTSEIVIDPGVFHKDLFQRQPRGDGEDTVARRLDLHQQRLQPLAAIALEPGMVVDPLDRTASAGLERARIQAPFDRAGAQEVRGSQQNAHREGRAEHDVAGR